MIAKICDGLHFTNVVTTEIWGSRKQSALELAGLFKENGCENVFGGNKSGKALKSL